MRRGRLQIQFRQCCKISNFYPLVCDCKLQRQICERSVLPFSRLLQAKYISIHFFDVFIYFFFHLIFYLGLAALIIMGKESLCNTENLLLWAVNKQMRLEGGFQVSIYIK